MAQVLEARQYADCCIVETVLVSFADLIYKLTQHRVDRVHNSNDLLNHRKLSLLQGNACSSIKLSLL